MIKPSSIITTSLSALVITFVMAAFFVQPVAAQTAKKLNCSGCVKSKQLKDSGIKSKDIKNGQVKNADLGSNAVTSGKIADGAVTLNKLGRDVTALGLEGVVVIGPWDFHGKSGDSINDWFIVSAGYVQGGDDPSVGCIGAPVHLPDGVTITEFELIFIDNSTEDFVVKLRRKSLLNRDLFEEMASVSTAGIDDNTFRTQSDTDINLSVVDAVDFSYFVQVSDCLDDDFQRIYGVRIFYQ